MTDYNDESPAMFAKADAINYRNYIAELAIIRKKLGR